jgi:hypothetical protein
MTLIFLMNSNAYCDFILVNFNITLFIIVFILMIFIISFTVTFLTLLVSIMELLIIIQ